MADPRETPKPTPVVPEEAVQAAAQDDLMEMLKNVSFQFWTCVNKAHKNVTWDGDVASCGTCGLTSEMTRQRDALVRADERRKVAEQIATAIIAVDPVEWPLAGIRAGEDAARIARQIGEASAALPEGR